MTFAEFIQRWFNQGIDFDGAYGYQCMDLMHQYHYDVLGIKDRAALRAPAAKDVFLNWPNINGSSLFEKINNTPSNFPQEGDIVFWGTAIGPFGHVAIAIKADENSFTSFDQNWPPGSLCNIVKHSYKGVLGWIRVKKPDAPTPTPPTTGGPMPNMWNKNDREAWRDAVAISYSKPRDVVGEREIDDAIGSNYPTPADWLLADQRLRVYEPQIAEAYQKGLKDGKIEIQPAPTPTPPTPTPVEPNPNPVPPNSGGTGGDNTSNDYLKQIVDLLTEIKNKLFSFFGGGGGK